MKLTKSGVQMGDGQANQVVAICLRFIVGCAWSFETGLTATKARSNLKAKKIR